MKGASFLRSQEFWFDVAGRREWLVLTCEISGEINGQTGMVVPLNLVDAWFSDVLDQNARSVSFFEALSFWQAGFAERAKAVGVCLQSLRLAHHGNLTDWLWVRGDSGDGLFLSEDRLALRVEMGPDGLLLGELRVRHFSLQTANLKIPQRLELSLANAQDLEQSLDNLFPQFVWMELRDRPSKKIWRWIR